MVVPAQSLRDAVAALPKLKDGTPLVICAKGIEQRTRKFMSDVVDDVLPGAPVAILSGPSFAVRCRARTACRGDACRA